MKALFLSMLFTISSIHAPVFADSQELQRKSWIEFLEIIEGMDSIRFSLIALPNIKCFPCSDVILGKDGMTPANEFFKDFRSMTFPDNLLLRLKTGETIYQQGMRDGAPFFEVLVTTIKPGEVDNFDGMQHAFMFKLENNEYKFSGLSTIP